MVRHSRTKPKGKKEAKDSSLASLLSLSILEQVTGADGIEKRLLHLHAQLKSVGKDDRPEGIEAVAEALVSRRVLDHEHKVHLCACNS